MTIYIMNNPFMHQSYWLDILAMVKISDNNVDYLLQIGYVEQNRDTLYIRLYKNSEIIRGCWIRDIIPSDYLHTLSPTLVEKCIEQVKRVEKLKAFS